MVCFLLVSARRLLWYTRWFWFETKSLGYKKLSKCSKLGFYDWGVGGGGSSERACSSSPFIRGGGLLRTLAQSSALSKCSEDPPPPVIKGELWADEIKSTCGDQLYMECTILAGWLSLKRFLISKIPSHFKNFKTKSESCPNESEFPVRAMS